jgi:hypothetical protein
MHFFLVPHPFEKLLWHPLVGSLSLSLKLVIIIVPLLLIFEFLRAIPFWSRIRTLDKMQTQMKHMGLSPHTLIPLFTGIFLGIAYGAGVIIKISKEKALPKTDMWFMGLFLATCHAVVEDTLLFIVIGGIGAWIIIPRLLIAFFLSIGVILMMKKR